MSKTILSSTINKYLYNAKELQVALDWQYDYGIRFYDTEIGRWNVVDSSADESEQVDKSPYAAFWNNFIMYDDSDGRCPNCLTAAIGEGIGALIKGGVEITTQLYNNGSVYNWSALGYSALQAAIPGVAAGFTGGASSQGNKNTSFTEGGAVSINNYSNGKIKK